MKYGLAAFLIIVSATAFAYDCKVTCPRGYKGGCVKSENGCDCSCDQDTNHAKEHIVTALRAANAPEEVVRRAQELLAERSEIPQTTLTADKTGREFTFFLKKQE